MEITPKLVFNFAAETVVAVTTSSAIKAVLPATQNVAIKLVYGLGTMLISAYVADEVSTHASLYFNIFQKNFKMKVADVESGN